MDYCSVSCQRADWKAFHKGECKRLCGKTKKKVGLMETRYHDLHKRGRFHPSVELPMRGALWEGDSLFAYLCNVDSTNLTIVQDTRVFPHGAFQFVPRE